MAFTDPQSITIAGVTSSLPRVSSGKYTSEYVDANGLIKLSAAHTFGKRERSVLRLDHSKITTDPFIPSQNVKVSMSNYIVFDVPPAGYTNAQQLEVYTGFRALFTASTDAIIQKLIANES